MTDPVDRLLARTTPGAGGCILWTGRTTKGGYSQVWVDGRNQLGHRVIYERFVGPIPDGLVIDHLCRRRNCLNHLHMEPVTRGQNVLRGESWSAQNARKTVCPKGHPLTEDNVMRRSRGTRECLTCHREREAQRRDVATQE